MQVTDEMVANAEAELSAVLGDYRYIMPSDGMRRVLTATLSDKQAGEVKALEWIDEDFASQVAVLGLTYTLQNGRDGWFAAISGGGKSSYFEGNFSTRDEAKAIAQADFNTRMLALVDVPAVEPVAHIIEGLNGEDPRVYLTQKYDPRSPDFWLNEEARAKHRVTPLYTSPPPTREGEDSAEVYRQALERIANASARGWNVETATEALNTARAIAATALAATRSGSATGSTGATSAGRNALDKERG